MSFTADLQDKVIKVELNRVVFENQLAHLESDAVVRYDVY